FGQNVAGLYWLALIGVTLVLLNRAGALGALFLLNAAFRSFGANFDYMHLPTILAPIGFLVAFVPSMIVDEIDHGGAQTRAACERISAGNWAQLGLSVAAPRPDPLERFKLSPDPLNHRPGSLLPRLNSGGLTGLDSSYGGLGNSSPSPNPAIGARIDP